jgi:hypothetical protein
MISLPSRNARSRLAMDVKYFIYRSLSPEMRVRLEYQTASGDTVPVIYLDNSKGQELGHVIVNPFISYRLNGLDELAEKLDKEFSAERCLKLFEKYKEFNKKL